MKADSQETGNNAANQKAILCLTTSSSHLSSEVKLATVVQCNQKAPFSIATTPRCRGGRYSFSLNDLLYPS